MLQKRCLSFFWNAVVSIVIYNGKKAGFVLHSSSFSKKTPSSEDQGLSVFDNGADSNDDRNERREERRKEEVGRGERSSKKRAA